MRALLVGLIVLIVLVSAVQVLVVVRYRNDPSRKLKLLALLGIFEAGLIVVFIWRFLMAGSS